MTSVPFTEYVQSVPRKVGKQLAQTASRLMQLRSASESLSSRRLCWLIAVAALIIAAILAANVLVLVQTRQGALDEVETILATMSLMALVVAGLIAAAAVLLARSWRQQNRLVEAEMKQQTDLATQAMLFNAAAENMPQGLDMFDASERLIVCNERYREMYGYTRDQTSRGATLQSILEARVAGRASPEDAATYVEQRLRRVREGKPYDVEDKLPDGRIIAISAVCCRAGDALPSTKI